MRANQLAEAVVEAIQPLTQAEIGTRIEDLTAEFGRQSSWPRWIEPAELVRRVQPWLGMN